MRPLLVACAAALLAVAFCGCSREEREEKEAEDVLLRQGLGLNKQAIAALAQKKGVAGLKSLLKSERATVRIAAISAMGTLRDSEEARQLLTDLCSGEDSEHAHWAIIALGVQGAPESKQAIEKFVHSPDPRRRQGACFAIFEYGDESLYPLLDVAAQDDDRGVRSAAELVKRQIAEGRVVPRGPRETPD